VTTPFIEARWPAPASVRAFTGTRCLVDENQLEQQLYAGAHYRRLRQVHGAGVVEFADSIDDVEADACISREPLRGCRVVTADCLPVLICNTRGTEVAAVHAGWRGLAAGVIENCVARMHSSPGDLLAWLGPAIGQGAFEVGEEVLVAFVSAAPRHLEAATRSCFIPGGAGKYHADLYALARLRLEQLGVMQQFGGEYCTFSQPELFHSFRRDGTSGRMISLIVFI
jgi:YfiH family protein